MALDADGLSGMISMVQDGRALGLAVQDLAVVPQADRVLIDVVLAENAEPNPAALTSGETLLPDLLGARRDSTFRLLVRLASRATIVCAPSQIPAHGHRTFWLRSMPAAPVQPKPELGAPDRE